MWATRAANAASNWVSRNSLSLAQTFYQEEHDLSTKDSAFLSVLSSVSSAMSGFLAGYLAGTLAKHIK